MLTSRTHNMQNEVTSVGGNTLTFDANGNMTTDETGKQFVYNAWNRLVQVKDSGETLLKTYGYDGLGRRVTETPNGGSTTDLYYSASWQVLEERVAGNVYARYVWSPVYVDALVLRDRDSDGNGSLDERLYALHDANFNVVALVNTSGAVVERYAYDPFGAVTVYSPTYAVLGSSGYAWTVGWQGMRYDAMAGVNFTWTRPYFPTLGRWGSPDWIEYLAGDVNLYRYVGNSPVNRVDPSGLFDPKWGTLGPTVCPTPQAAPPVLRPVTPVPPRVGPPVAPNFIPPNIGNAPRPVPPSVRLPAPPALIVRAGLYGVIFAEAWVLGDTIGEGIKAGQELIEAVEIHIQYEELRQKKRQEEYETYKDVCSKPPPPGLTGCDLWKWQLERNSKCLELRKAWDNKWMPGRHKKAIEDLERSVKNLEDKIAKNCNETPPC